MGNMHATEFASMTKAGEISIDDALRWHLQANHYPPIPASMIEPCKKAIEACQEQDWHKPVELPEGISFKGSDHAPAIEVVEAHHLFAWLED